MELAKYPGNITENSFRSAGYVCSAGYVLSSVRRPGGYVIRRQKMSVAPDMPCPPSGVPADMLSAVKKCPNLFMLWGFAIPSNQAVASISMG